MVFRTTALSGTKFQVTYSSISLNFDYITVLAYGHDNRSQLNFNIRTAEFLFKSKYGGNMGI